MEEIKKSKQNKIINILLSFVIFILLILFGLKINFTKVVVNGSSMHPTLIGNYEDGYEYGYTDRFLYKITGKRTFVYWNFYNNYSVNIRVYNLFYFMRKENEIIAK